MRRLALALLFLAAGAAAQTMSKEDLRTVYAELARIHDGRIYTVHMVGTTSEAAARSNWEEISQPRYRKLRLDHIFTNVAPLTGYLFTFDPPLRERLATLRNGERAGPIRTQRGWVIVELVGTRPAAMPPLESMEANIPGLVAAGAVPSAAQLRGGVRAKEPGK